MGDIYQLIGKVIDGVMISAAVFFTSVGLTQIAYDHAFAMGRKYERQLQTTRAAESDLPLIVEKSDSESGR